ncbi:serine/threonine-protein kinase [Streptomyces agglomeratus]|uniref:serine/threonine-protein kinase n=1 Tax=Streptomyces agglomeratus TaxID=285458 RepID=UPI002109ADAD|nr:serine/threonine protein kinase [Streptomyces agglomeratus]
MQELSAEDPSWVGRYRIVGRLGAGGMGRVYLGRSPSGRAVAVKVIRAELAEDADFRRRFAREISAARRVTGFFTAAVVDADAEKSPAWLATAYIPGMSLEEAVRAHGCWTETSVLALGAGLAEALEAIHSAGVIHRDLKPSNVLLAIDGPRVIDFGISVAAENSILTRTGMMVGTPGYMSPEQVTGKAVGRASDVFALGAVLTFAATGAGPFGSGSAHGVNFRAVYEEPALDQLPPALKGIVGSCLAKEPGRRPTVAALLDQTAAAREGAAEVPTNPDWLPPPVAKTVRTRTAEPPLRHIYAPSVAPPPRQGLAADETTAAYEPSLAESESTTDAPSTLINPAGSAAPTGPGAQPADPPTKHAGQSTVVRTIAWTTLFTTWLYGLAQLAVPISVMIEALASPTLELSFRELATGSRDHGVTLIDIIVPFFNMLTGFLVWRFARRPSIYSWTAVGAILGYGLADAAGIPLANSAYLYSQVAVYGDHWLADVIVTARTVLGLVAVTGLIAAIRMRPRFKITRPAGYATPIAILILSLGSAYVGFFIALNTEIGIGGLVEYEPSGKFARALVIALLASLLPVFGIIVQPHRFAAGLFVGWMLFALSIEVQFLFSLGYDDAILPTDTFMTAEYSLFGLMSLGLCCAYWKHQREKRHRDQLQTLR